MNAHYKAICEIVDGDVSAEVIATDFEGMVREGEALAALHENIVVKVPMIPEGIKAISHFTAKRHPHQLHVDLLSRPGVDRGQGRRILRQPIHWPPRRHQLRWHGPHRGHPKHLRQLRLWHGNSRGQRPRPHARD